mmetsp:Transcript_25663/g.65297  ORF Transcript_25663/g.65297 Transcript_25663/m.65297 type:complete len:348 (+) Transcript_25663:2163-3206(+)
MGTREPTRARSSSGQATPRRWFMPRSWCRPASTLCAQGKDEVTTAGQTRRAAGGTRKVGTVPTAGTTARAGTTSRAGTTDRGRTRQDGKNGTTSRAGTTGTKRLATSRAVSRAGGASKARPGPGTPSRQTSMASRRRQRGVVLQVTPRLLTGVGDLRTLQARKRLQPWTRRSRRQRSSARKGCRQCMLETSRTLWRCSPRPCVRSPAMRRPWPCAQQRSWSSAMRMRPSGTRRWQLGFARTWPRRTCGRPWHSRRWARTRRPPSRRPCGATPTAGRRRKPCSPSGRRRRLRRRRRLSRSVPTNVRTAVTPRTWAPLTRQTACGTARAAGMSSSLTSPPRSPPPPLRP